MKILIKFLLNLFNKKNKHKNHKKINNYTYLKNNLIQIKLIQLKSKLLKVNKIYQIMFLLKIIQQLRIKYFNKV